MVGLEGTLELIWRAFEKQYAAERTPGQDILRDLMTGAILNRSNSESYWKFVHQCTMAARAMKHNEIVKATLMVPHNQEMIARRLGHGGFEEWTFYRQKQLRKNRTTTFQTFCEWIETKAATIQACETKEQTQARETNNRQTYQSTQPQSPQSQRRRELYDRYQSNNQNRPQPTPGAPTFCAWCRENELQDDHATKSCRLFKEANNTNQWTASP